MRNLRWRTREVGGGGRYQICIPAVSLSTGIPKELLGSYASPGSCNRVNRPFQACTLLSGSSYDMINALTDPSGVQNSVSFSASTSSSAKCRSTLKNDNLGTQLKSRYCVKSVRRVVVRGIDCGTGRSIFLQLSVGSRLTTERLGESK